MQYVHLFLEVLRALEAVVQLPRVADEGVHHEDAVRHVLADAVDRRAIRHHVVHRHASDLETQQGRQDRARGTRAKSQVRTAWRAERNEPSR